MGSDSVTRKAFPMRKAKLRSVELPMKENTLMYTGPYMPAEAIQWIVSHPDNFKTQNSQENQKNN